MVERFVHIEEVGGSSPPAVTSDVCGLKVRGLPRAFIPSEVEGCRGVRILSGPLEAKSFLSQGKEGHF